MRWNRASSADKYALSFSLQYATVTFPDATFDGILAYYSVLYTPKRQLPALLREFRRVLKPQGLLLVVAKEGEGEGFVDDPMGKAQKTFFANFVEPELRALAEMNGFECTFSETRAPLTGEIPIRRIYIMARKSGNRVPS